MGKGRTKILLLGSSGMFGTAIEDICARKGIECIGLTHQDIEITCPGELKAAIARHRPSVVINSVAIPRIDLCKLDPKKAFDVNSTAVSNLAGLCRDNNILLVQISTNAIFDGRRKRGFYTERSKPNPINIYAATKYAAESFVRGMCKRYYIARLPMIFGRRRNKNRGFVDNVLNSIKEGKKLRIADDRIDTFAYTRDLADSLMSMIESQIPFGTYHLANSGKASYYDFVLELVRLLGANAKVERAKHRDFKTSADKPLNTPFNSIKLKPLRSWQEALTEYVRDLEKEPADA